MTWSVVQTESQRELVAEGHLKRGGFETYLPRIRIRTHGRTRNVALFPCYVFAQVGDRWQSARWSIAVIRVCMKADAALQGRPIDDLALRQPACVPDEFINVLRKSEDQDGFIRLPKEPSTQLKKGQRV